MLWVEIWGVAMLVQIASFATLVAIGNANPNRELGTIKSARPITAALALGFMVSVIAGFQMALTVMTLI